MERMKALKDDFELGLLNKVGHANFCMRCLSGLPGTMSEADPSRVAIGFYCLGALDILGQLETKVNETDREAWRAWIWAQQVQHATKTKHWEGTQPSSALKDVGLETSRDVGDFGERIGGFRPGPFMSVGFGIDDQTGSDTASVVQEGNNNAATEADPPHLIMTYTSLLSLAILRDDFRNLDREGLINLLRSTQKSDGSFTAFPGQGESDIRMVYTAFAISAMLNDWRGVDVPRAIAFTKWCMSYEGGFGQVPGNEAQGGSSYCALATLALAPEKYRAEVQLTTQERKRLERWLIQRQKPRQVYISYEEDEDEEDISILAPQLAQIQISSQGRIDTDEGEGGSEGESKEVKNEKKVKVKEIVEEEGGGFGGRTEKAEDACYSFWCGAALRILRSGAVGGRDRFRSSQSTPTQTNNSPYSVIASSSISAPEAEAGNDNFDDILQQQRTRREDSFHNTSEEEEEEIIDRLTHARFISRCQFRLGGLGKSPGAHPDPYHTYLALAGLALYPPPSYHTSPSYLRHDNYPLPHSPSRAQTNSTATATSNPAENENTTPNPQPLPVSDQEPSPAQLLQEIKSEKKRKERDTWRLKRLDALINATEETSRWVRERLSNLK